jgi:hypothetical protein
MLFFLVMTALVMQYLRGGFFRIHTWFELLVVGPVYLIFFCAFNGVFSYLIEEKLIWRKYTRIRVESDIPGSRYFTYLGFFALSWFIMINILGAILL